MKGFGIFANLLSLSRLVSANLLISEPFTFSTERIKVVTLVLSRLQETRHGDIGPNCL